MVDEKKIIAGANKSPLKRKIESIGGFRMFWIFSIIFSFAIIAFFITGETPNIYFIDENETIHEFDRPEEVPEGLQEVILYGRYDEDGNFQKVPSSSFSFGQFVIFSIFHLFMFLLSIQKNEEEELIKGQKAVDIVEAFLKNEQLKSKGNWTYDFGLIPRRALVHFTIGEKRFPVWWAVYYIIWSGEENNFPTYYVQRVDCKTGDLIKTGDTTLQYSQKDNCPDCGKNCDVKILTTEEYDKMMQLARGQFNKK